MKDTLTLGEKKGTKWPYLTNVTLYGDAGATCGDDDYYPQVQFKSYGMGIDLPVTALFDGTGPDDDTFATFISNIQAENTFTVTIDMAPPDDLQSIDEVIFNLGGKLKTGTKVSDNVYKATYDMQYFDSPQTLTVTCKIKKTDGSQIEETAEYRVKALKLPAWVNVINNIADEESYKQEFVPDEKHYSFEFKYPTNFAWHDYVPGSVGLLGGLENRLAIEFTANATYNINETSQFGAAIAGSPRILGHEFSVEGGLSGTFDPAFQFQRGNGLLKASTSFDLPEKGYSKTFLVYGVPITVAVDLSGNVEIYVNGSAVLNKKLEFESIKVTPGTTVTGNITLSLSAVLGLAKLAATGSPTATVEIEIAYTSASGTATTWRGEVVVPIKIEGSIFWGLGSAELYSTELGPWSFGTGRSPSAFRPLEVTGPPSPRFISTSDMDIDADGRKMVIWTKDTVGPPNNPNPDIFYRYYGSSWGDAAPIIGSSSPNDEWESDPAVVFMSGGKALAAWTANDGAHTLNKLYEILAAQDIAFSVWDGSSWTAPGLIINDSEADGTVQLAYDSSNNKVMAVWLHDTDPHTDNKVTRTGWRLLNSIYDPADTSWSAPETVSGTGSDSADFMPSLATDGSGNALLLWIHDQDGKFHTDLESVADGTNVDYTNSDCNVYWSKWTGSTWNAPAAITGSNSAGEFFPAVAFAPDNKALAVWVEKTADSKKLLYSVFDLVQNQWSQIKTIHQSDQFIEEVKVVVDSGGNATVIWRGYSGGTGELFASHASMTDLQWSAPEQITHDDMVDWNVSTALDKNNKIMTLWSKYDPSIGSNNSGSGFSGGLNLAQPSPGTANLAGTYSDQGVDTDSDGKYDVLKITAGVNIAAAGNYEIIADLYTGRKIYTSKTTVNFTATGDQTIDIGFPGQVISEAGSNGPYYLKNVVLMDKNGSAVQTDFSASAYTTTGTYTADMFAPVPVKLDKNEYTGSSQKAVITVTDAGENTDSGTSQTVKVQVVSTPDPVGINVTLTETGADTGIFTGNLDFSAVSSSQDNYRILVSDHGLFQVIYDDSEPHYRYTASAVWLTSAVPGDLNVDNSINLADAVIALKVISNVNPSGINPEYTGSETDLDGDLKIGQSEVIYILQKVADIR